MSEDTNGWNEYKQLVLASQKRHDAYFEKITTEIQNLRNDVTTLKIKSGIWGAAAGAIPVIILLIVDYLKGAT